MSQPTDQPPPPPSPNRPENPHDPGPGTQPGPEDEPMEDFFEYETISTEIKIHSQALDESISEFISQIYLGRFADQNPEPFIRLEDTLTSMLSEVRKTLLDLNIDIPNRDPPSPPATGMVSNTGIADILLSAIHNLEQKITNIEQNAKQQARIMHDIQVDQSQMLFTSSTTRNANHASDTETGDSNRRKRKKTQGNPAPLQTPNPPRMKHPNPLNPTEHLPPTTHPTHQNPMAPPEINNPPNQLPSTTAPNRRTKTDTSSGYRKDKNPLWDPPPFQSLGRSTPISPHSPPPEKGPSYWRLCGMQTAIVY